MSIEYKANSFAVAKTWSGLPTQYIVATWTPLAMKCAGVAESDMLYQATVTHEHAYRFAEHEHGDGAEPEQSDAREAGCRAEGGG